MRCWTQKLVVILATGYILFFHSERVFWSFLRPGDKFRQDRAIFRYLGAGLGSVAGWWPAELGHTNTSLVSFAAHAMACTILYIAAWLVLGMAGSEWFRPAKLEMPILLGVVALFFLGVRVPATPRSVLVLPPLLLLCGRPDGLVPCLQLN